MTTSAPPSPSPAPLTGRALNEHICAAWGEPPESPSSVCRWWMFSAWTSAQKGYWVSVDSHLSKADMESFRASIPLPLWIKHGQAICAWVWLKERHASWFVREGKRRWKEISSEEALELVLRHGKHPEDKAHARDDSPLGYIVPDYQPPVKIKRRKAETSAPTEVLP